MFCSLARAIGASFGRFRDDLGGKKRVNDGNAALQKNMGMC